MKRWRIILAGAFVSTMLMTTPARAEWINMEKGPGVAQWVDENGKVTEPPGAAMEGGKQGREAGQQDGTQNGAAAQPDDTQNGAAVQPDGTQNGEAAQPGGTQSEVTAPEATPEETAQGQTAERYIDPAKPMVALTFDDGPQTNVDNQIMDCLSQYGGKATFFIVGERVASRQPAVQRMVAEGHEVANHTMNHKYLQKQSAAEIQRQVRLCNDAVLAACGVRPAVMRLPGGGYNNTVLANTNMPMIQWSIDTLDWKTRNADKTVAAVVGKVKDGDIVLMHDLYSQTGEAALRIIPELTAQGYQLVTVSEMAAAKGRPLQAGKIYSSLQ